MDASVCVTKCICLCGDREREGGRTEPGSVCVMCVEREGDGERGRENRAWECVYGCVTERDYSQETLCVCVRVCVHVCSTPTASCTLKAQTLPLPCSPPPPPLARTTSHHHQLGTRAGLSPVTSAGREEKQAQPSQTTPSMAEALRAQKWVLQEEGERRKGLYS